MKVLFKYFKKIDLKNRIVIPKFLVEKYGKDYYLEYCDDETIRLVPVKKGR
ncbi:MAG: hypothetical protein IJ690_02020 [Clostridia bacterium]|nr:hypothetical protein [Clostridia bacterium]MBR1653718.1 hypothetical protein [Clostridia bacterium]